jgi:hypothetical protein
MLTFTYGLTLNHLLRGKDAELKFALAPHTHNVSIELHNLRLSLTRLL